MRGVPFVQVTRGDLVESVHALAACAVDASGKTLFAVGDIEAPVYLRSAAKPFIAAAVVESGAVERFAFSVEEIAMIAASHQGEEEHLRVVAGMLSKMGLDATALQCGAPRGLTSLHTGCSGKHAGILALCRMMDVGIQGYLDAEHPAQQCILAFCARMLDEEVAAMPIAVDGCGIPVIATSLRQAARAFSRLAKPENAVREEDARALLIVRDAMMMRPWYVAGTGRFDTCLMETARGRIVAKNGAEGVHGLGILDTGTGCAFKVIDGNERAIPPAVLAFLEKLDALDVRERESLRLFSRKEVRNVAGHLVGMIAVSEHALRLS